MFAFCTSHFDESKDNSIPTCRASSANTSPNTFVDRYQIDSRNKLGAGNYGTVYKAFDRFTGEDIAIKTVFRNRMSDLSVKDEALIMASAKHPNIVGLRDVLKDNNSWHIVMDLAKGSELYDRLVKRGLMKRETTVKVMKQLIEAVAYLHNNDIVHGDIKPENCILDETEGCDPFLKLADFGSAFFVGDVDAKNKDYTVSYSPPEVVSRRGLMSPSGDIWSLGIMACILLTGSHPFDYDDEASEELLADRIVNDRPFFNRSWNAVDEQAKCIILRALSKNPALRPTAEEMLSCPWIKRDPIC
eukprot:CAMPEP_0171461772 /NCGR_PEP_ID=MMETSP0945-20130129/6083_1 /TAXON_ID=109269 /ORGANISM="Vaucheria litorea, Strain CCMP2940" /LENGTH=301 /DNA_ID=CAMNT_0011988179 /DNA_START=112 /DNA_END=1017 /DNA_ORIENTATION=+